MIPQRRERMLGLAAIGGSATPVSRPGNRDRVDGANRARARNPELLGMPDVKATLSSQGLEPAPGTPEQFGACIRSERVKWARVSKESGAKAA